MKYHIHRLSCFDAQVHSLNTSGKETVKEVLRKMRDGEGPRDAIDDDGTIKKILSGTGVDKSKIGSGVLEFNLTGHWRIFAYKTGPWVKTTELKDKFGKAVTGAEAIKNIYDGTYWPVKIGHLEASRCITPSGALV